MAEPAAAPLRVAPAGARARPGARPIEDAVQWLSRWLVVALLIDIVVNRVATRLAIFIPKGEPLATLGAITGRIGAAADALVPLVVVTLLGALLVAQGRSGDWLTRLQLLAVAVVGAGGVVLLLGPPHPGVLAVIDLLTIAVVVGTLYRLAIAHRPPAARLGMGLLAASIVAVAAVRLMQLGGSVGGWELPPSTALAATAAGEWSYLAGLMTIGIAGVAGTAGRGRGRLVPLAGVITAMLLVGAVIAPASWSALVIWSLGLSAWSPVLAIALALGVGVAGLIHLRRTERQLAMGAATVALAGYGLAASGLALAGLLGLIVATSATPAE